MKKALLGAAATAMYLLLLVALYWIDISWFKIDVVFYSALRVAVLGCLIGAGVLLSVPALRRSFGGFERAQLVLIWALLGYILAISVPTVIDRSLSFYILEKLQQRGGGIRLDRFHTIFTTEYMREHRLVEIRLTEQQASGTLVIDNGCVKLTSRGENLADFSRFFRRHLLPRQRLVSGEYTDQLIDPFQRSDLQPDYLCR